MSRLAVRRASISWYRQPSMASSLALRTVASRTASRTCSRDSSIASLSAHSSLSCLSSTKHSARHSQPLGPHWHCCRGLAARKGCYGVAKSSANILGEGAKLACDIVMLAGSPSCSASTEQQRFFVVLTTFSASLH